MNGNTKISGTYKKNLIKMEQNKMTIQEKERLVQMLTTKFNVDELHELTTLLKKDKCKVEILPIVSSSMADKAQMINALTNTMAVNKKELGGYHSLRDNSLEKLYKLIESIDI